MINNPINELSDDDENYINSYDSSLVDDDNKDYDENVDMSPYFERNMNYISREHPGKTEYDTTSSDSKMPKNYRSDSTSSETPSLSKNIFLTLNKFLIH